MAEHTLTRKLIATPQGLIFLRVAVLWSYANYSFLDTFMVPIWISGDSVFANLALSRAICGIAKC